MCAAMRVYTGTQKQRRHITCTKYITQDTQTHTHTYSSMKLSNYNSEHKNIDSKIHGNSTILCSLS